MIGGKRAGGQGCSREKKKRNTTIGMSGRKRIERARQREPSTKSFELQLQLGCKRGGEEERRKTPRVPSLSEKLHSLDGPTIVRIVSVHRKPR